jgi:SAM-dependent methyltransferase
MSTIDYNHNENRHSLEGPRTALPLFFRQHFPKSILDVGCGTGTWLRAAIDLGITDVCGLDGVDIAPEDLHVPEENFKCCNFAGPIDLGRKFDMVMCLEVAEHLDAKYSENLIKTLTKHSDRVIFSAACPGQDGQHHVNCKWPDYWQALFNKFGFVCEDTLRWSIWNNSAIEPWYRQNVFVAVRNPVQAGKEQRILGVVHPEIASYFLNKSSDFQNSICEAQLRQIEAGAMPLSWYVTKPLFAFLAKFKRRLP